MKRRVLMWCCEIREKGWSFRWWGDFLEREVLLVRA